MIGKRKERFDQEMQEDAAMMLDPKEEKKYKRIVLKVIEFDSLFGLDSYLKNGKTNLINLLANTSNTDLFSIDLIQIIVNTFWDYYFWRIILIVVAP